MNTNVVQPNREVVLHINQLLSGTAGRPGTGGLLQAELASIVTIPVVNDDTFIITDGTTTETFTFKTTDAAAFQVAIGASAATAQTNLIAAINEDSKLWSAVATVNLGRFFAAAYATQFIVYRKIPAPEPSAAAADRIYGNQTTAAGIKVVSFSEVGYSTASATEASIPATDPGAKRFGPGRSVMHLEEGEEHRCAEDSFTYCWSHNTRAWRFQWHMNDLGLACWQYPLTTVYLACTGASAELAADLPAGHYVLVSDTAMTFIISASGGGGTAVSKTAPGIYWPADFPFALTLRAAKRIAVIMGGLSGSLMVMPVASPPVI